MTHASSKVCPELEMDKKEFSESRKRISSLETNEKILQKCNLLPYTFPDKDEEDLYQAFRQQQLYDAFIISTAFGILFGISAIISNAVDFHPEDWPFLTFGGVLVVLNVTVAFLLKLKHLPDRIAVLFPLFLWIFKSLEIIAHLVLIKREYIEISDDLAWQVLLVYFCYVLIPIPYHWCFVLTLLSSAVHLAIVVIFYIKKSGMAPDLLKQIAANILLYICSMYLGSLSYLIFDKKQRKSFLETRASLSIKKEIETEYKQQEELLLSVLPKHVAVELMQDIDGVMDGQFRKIYMSRHEDVSILFADIVGFTAISSKVTAPALVKLLNKLFAKFDKLAMMYRQLRIKILGDCYYCICGAPDPRPDHAVLSVYMGLAVIEAIRSIRETTDSDVDMRVGIHTGAVIGGVLGQRQWQFDILGKDVVLANKMESSGKPGRVHISKVTRQYLKDEFELEPGLGDKRDNHLRQLGMNTFFVKTVLQKDPVVLEEDKSQILLNIETDTEAEKAMEIPARKSVTDIKYFREVISRKNHFIDVYRTVNWCTMKFEDESLEEKYQYRHEKFFGLSMTCLPVVLVFTILANICVLPSSLLKILTFISGEILLIAITMLALASSYTTLFPRSFASLAEQICVSPWRRTLMAAFAMLITTTSDTVAMVGCVNEHHPNKTVSDHLHGDECLYPAYLTDCVVLSLLSLSVLTQIEYLTKLIVLTMIAITQCIILSTVVHAVFEENDHRIYHERHDEYFATNYFLILTTAAVTGVCLYFNRQTEKMSRKLFLWKEESLRQKDEMLSMRQKNEALVYNLLPEHVARRYIGTRKQDEELYSHSYEDVGVLFASCPNFTDFYTEDSITKGGLECLRFLNEIISDYDEILQEQRFASICKIKTIGSAYMAASGMTDPSSIYKSPQTQVRWRHLDDLVQFAICLQETLDKLNKESFNNLVLRMGINHGPLIAGVIGARKPHYDIWGNTVNVASRMESTGEVRKIQVVEDSMKTLSEFGYRFQERGVIDVKGKGKLKTYYLTGKIVQPDEEVE